LSIRSTGPRRRLREAQAPGVLAKEASARRTMALSVQPILRISDVPTRRSMRSSMVALP
jgi:hypothetical protein